MAPFGPREVRSESGGRASTGRKLTALNLPIHALLRAERNPSDAAVLGEADPPLGGAVGEMGHVDVAAHAGDAAKRHRAQRTKPAHNGLVKGKLLMRLRRHL